ncbi:hypothetical protein Ddye_021230 [Dipteronia dyeriana]|uniref:Reverse transcriptase zinc-binding domain-containing protein n=1 Tax=Dipteronia dyeriana TaxID=168575 RepID=A0AAD9WXS7_9ROSI|nr:hypothetical protein Ddye_021230 [Dipteronia dyeriana]
MGHIFSRLSILCFMLIILLSILLKMAFKHFAGVVKEFGRNEGSKWDWDVKLRRHLFGWERDQWNCFVLSLDSIIIRKRFHDTLAWSHYSNGLFSVSSFRRCLEGSSAYESSVAPLLWKGLCPLKVDIFLWQVLRGRTLVKEVIHRLRGGQLVDLICSLYGEEYESVDHLFLFYGWSEIMVVLHAMVGCLKLLQPVHQCVAKCLGDLCHSAKRKKAWNSLFVAIIWTIWEVRNNVVFKNIQANLGIASDSVRFRVC